MTAGVRTHLSALCNNVAKLALAPIRERGAVETLRSIRTCAHALRQERAEAFDERYGTDTARRVTLDDLFAKGDDVMTLWRYFATLEAPFHRLMAAIERPHGRAFTDLGCGKGRAMLMASLWPFRRIIGVELAPSLLAVARRNVEIFHDDRQECRTFELVHGDAADWRPPRGPFVIYMFQPFPRPVMASMLAKLERSLDEDDRAATIAYMNPLFSDQVTASGRFRLQAAEASTVPAEFGWGLYSNGTAP